MQPNSISSEIRSTRDELARKSGYNVRKLMDRVRKQEKVVTPTALPKLEKEKAHW